MSLNTLVHDHLTMYRVVRRDWANPVDATFSQHSDRDNRWNTPDFPALYCCCSESVARAIVRDIFRVTGADLSDLQDAARPQLVEIHWTGDPVDMITARGLVAAGFSEDYPTGSDHSQTREVARRWHYGGAAGILCRSASLARLGFRNWIGDHPPWSELAIYAENAPVRPSVQKRRDDLDWLQS